MANPLHTMTTAAYIFRRKLSSNIVRNYIVVVSKKVWRFRHFLWSSQNIWSLKKYGSDRKVHLNDLTGYIVRVGFLKIFGVLHTLVRGHSTTMWIQFDPILTSHSPQVGGQAWIFCFHLSVLSMSSWGSWCFCIYFFQIVWLVVVGLFLVVKLAFLTRFLKGLERILQILSLKDFLTAQ